MSGKTPRFSARNAIACHLGEDGADVEGNRRYQPTRTYCPVYTVGEDYFTATRSAKSEPRDGAERWGMSSFNWQRVDSWVTAAYGWQIWRHDDAAE